ncbi:hypothetical protein PMAYCL1PPCAC_33027, partial [Pristionchus mayeri]
LEHSGGARAARTCVSVLFCCAIVALVATIFYLICARRRQNSTKKRRFELARHSLSGQYQMAENERCDRFIAIYIPFQDFSFLFSSFVGALLVFQVERKDPRKYLLFVSLLYLTIAPRVMISMLIPLTRHPALLKQFKKILRRRRHSEAPDRYALSHSASKHAGVHSASGKPLTFTTEEEAALYFENYATAWGRS